MRSFVSFRRLVSSSVRPALRVDRVAALEKAVERGDVASVDVLLVEGGHPSASWDRGTTALHEAAYHNQVEVARYLLAKGADIEARAHGGVTPLWIGCQENALATAKLLLDAQADVHASYENASCLYIASQMGHLDMMVLLLQQGSNPSDGSLHGALHEDQIKAVEVLIEHGANVNRYFEDGGTPLWLAAAKGMLPVVELLLKHHADVDTRVYEMTPLEIATKRRHEKVAALLKTQSEL